MSETLDILIKARDSISKPDNWAIGTRLSEDGNARCALGALDHAIGIVDGSDYPDTKTRIYMEPLKYKPHNALLALAEAIPEKTPEIYQENWAVARYNNTHTHEEVLAWFDRAIERQKIIEKSLEVKPVKELV